MLISIPVKLQSFRHGKSKIGQDFLSMRFTKLVKFGKEGTGSKEKRDTFETLAEQRARLCASYQKVLVLMFARMYTTNGGQNRQKRKVDRLRTWLGSQEEKKFKSKKRGLLTKMKLSMQDGKR